ncbi:MAG: hypothetical protein AAF790_06330, partial [Planctomycetota bacterium]
IRSYPVPPVSTTAGDTTTDAAAAGDSSADQPTALERRLAALQAAGQPSQQPSNSPAPSGEPTHRMLAAIVRGEPQAWFFKFTAPVEDAEKVASGVNAFFDSIAIGAADAEPTWTLPPGWQADGPRQMRLATLRVPIAGPETTAGDTETGANAPAPAELSVIGLPAGSDWQAYLLANVNRWRGQMQLPPLDRATLAEQARPLKGAPDGSVAIELRGWFNDAGMRAPFAGAGRPTTRQPPAAGPPRLPAAAPAAPRRAASAMTSDPPESWVDLGQRPMRVKTYRIDATPTAEVVVSAWPAAAQMSKLLPNINRWRGQVGLPNLTAEELGPATEPVEIDGVDSVLTVCQGAERSMMAAVSVRGDKVWFFKLTGGAEAASAHRDRFVQWLGTIRMNTGNPTE